MSEQPLGRIPDVVLRGQRDRAPWHGSRVFSSVNHKRRRLCLRAEDRSEDSRPPLGATGDVKAMPPVVPTKMGNPSFQQCVVVERRPLPRRRPRRRASPEPALGFSS